MSDRASFPSLDASRDPCADHLPVIKVRRGSKKVPIN